MASEEGGTEIEEVAAQTPEKIFKETIDPVVGLSPYQARRIAFNINIPKESVGKATKFYSHYIMSLSKKIVLLLKLTHLLQLETVKYWL